MNKFKITYLLMSLEDKQALLNKNQKHVDEFQPIVQYGETELSKMCEFMDEHKHVNLDTTEGFTGIELEVIDPKDDVWYPATIKKIIKKKIQVVCDDGYSFWIEPKDLVDDKLYRINLKQQQS